MVNISVARERGEDISKLLDLFNDRYIHEAPIMCGYCKESRPELEPAIQLTRSEIEKFRSIKKHDEW
jgi:hypothetical protein